MRPSHAAQGCHTPRVQYVQCGANPGLGLRCSPFPLFSRARQKSVLTRVAAQRIQELLHECKTAMTLKELEKKASTEKGVVAQSVKEVVDELIADNLVW